jgi:KUP system potassium uptake protein
LTGVAGGLDGNLGSGPALTTSDAAPALQHEHSAKLAALVLGALGVVFGDIGTSPLYTLKECLIAAGGAKAQTADLYGILSLMLWALMMVVTVKYLCFIMRADHHGEGASSPFWPSCRTDFAHTPPSVDGSPAWRSWQ